MLHSCQPTAQHGVQVTPLARPQTWGVVHARSVPSRGAIYQPASGAPDARRWAAPPTSSV